MKNFLLPILFFFMLSCDKPEQRPEPHLELGQRISFVGGDPEADYVVIGYRNLLESKTDAKWNNQNYIVFIYVDKNDQVQQATVHKNAILKR